MSLAGHDSDEAFTPEPGSPYSSSVFDKVSFLLKLRERGFRDTAMLRAFERVSREMFAPRRYADLARRDMALPLPCGQVMTAPFSVARLLTALEVAPTHRVLEIGTGSGYVAALLSHLAREVTTVERYRTLAIEAQAKLTAIERRNVALFHDDGLAFAPGQSFDRILVHGCLAQPDHFIRLLSPDGRLVCVYGPPDKMKLTSFLHHADGEVATLEAGILRLAPLTRGIAAVL